MIYQHIATYNALSALLINKVILSFFEDNEDTPTKTLVLITGLTN